MCVYQDCFSIFSNILELDRIGSRDNLASIPWFPASTFSQKTIESSQVVTILSKQTNIAVAVLVGVSICAISFAWDAGNDFKLSESMKLGFLPDVGLGWVGTRAQTALNLGRLKYHYAARSVYDW